MGYQVFVAISTGQQVANLPPILECARKGDRVLWLESEQAARANWSDGAWRVLHDRGLEQSKASINGDMDEPVAVADSLITAVKNARIAGNGCSQINIVLNGGKKLTPVGLVFAVQEMQESKQLTNEVWFLYGDHQPAQMKIHQPNIMAYQRIQPYSADRMLAIEEIFLTNRLTSPQIGRRWSWRQQCEPEAYGIDPQLTRLVHDCYVRGFDDEAENLPDKAGWPAYECWTEESQNAWRKKVADRLNQLGMAVRGKSDELARRISADARSFWPSVIKRKLADDERAVLAREGWINDAGGMRLGLRFELAVWRRTVAFLIAHPQFEGVVKECLLSVQVDRDGRREKDLDVVLVLANGILIHLECKTWTFEKKDADARLLVLQKASSRLARMYTVAPMFSSLADAGWFPKMHDQFENLKSNLGVANVIAYTMPDPPDEYGVYKSKLNRTAPFKSPPPFEESLQKILTPFLPA